ncbi:MAG: hypothetical protein Q9166_000136 [cf. Caloplaca sp. 2 TL-2023]
MFSTSNSPTPSLYSGDLFWLLAMFSKWTSLNLTYGSWLAVHMGRLPALFPLVSLLVGTSLSSDIYLLSREAWPQFMEAPSLQLTANPPRSYWTLPVSREETLALREKFRKVGWRKPNHISKTTKIIARAKKI